MQLTAKFAVLAAALAYGSSSVLALPYGKFLEARQVENDIEARNIPEDVTYAAREVPELSLDARSFFDTEDYEARELPSVSTNLSSKLQYSLSNIFLSHRHLLLGRFLVPAPL